MADAICLGELLVDFVTTDLGESVGKCTSFTRTPGGAPANVAVGLAKLGIKAALIARLGNDPFGQFVVTEIASKGVDISHVTIDFQIHTTLAFIQALSNEKKGVAFWRGADCYLGSDELDTDFIKESKVFHFGGMSLSCSPIREATLFAAQYAHEA